MRTNLITHFYCSNCGSQLAVAYDSPDLPAAKPAKRQTFDEPTGADCRYVKLFVEPCRACIDGELEPARQLANAIQQLITID